MKFNVTKVNDPLWNEIVGKCESYDFHHTSCFHKIETNDNQEAILVTVNDDDDYICLPLIIRPIENTQFYDATSVYGYCGPIYTKPVEDFSLDVIDFFKQEFIRFCEKQSIISVFARLHPLIPQNYLLKDFGKVIPLNKTVVIDLREPADIQRQKYSRSFKTQINGLRKKKGYTVKSISTEDLNIFKEIYFETMDRVEATDYYYFNDEYLNHLIKNNCYDTRVLIAYNMDDKPVAGAIFTIAKDIMQYHLGGTTDEALHDAPIKLIMDEARLLANDLGLKYFNLGGGHEGSDEDSLFYFKRGFSDFYLQFSVWNLIVNSEIYQKLVDEKGLTQSNHPNFFPLYRAK